MRWQIALWHCRYFNSQFIKRLQHTIVKNNDIARVLLQFSFAQLMCNRKFFLFSRFSCRRFRSIRRCCRITASIGCTFIRFLIGSACGEYDYKNDCHEQHRDFFIHLRSILSYILFKIDCNFIAANLFNRNFHIIHFT
ncbi:hypothetical protein D3C80_1291820 [compost metagenome]